MNAVAEYVSRGYSKTEALTFAMRDAHVSGVRPLNPPALPAGWRAISARFRAGKVAWAVTQTKGNKWKLVDSNGQDLCGPDLLAPVIFWANDEGWIR